MQTSIATQVDRLLRARDSFPADAVREIIARRDDAVGPLLELLEKAADDPESASDSDYMGHIYAAMLLASFRERRAHPLLVKCLGTCDEHLLDHVWGGMMLDYMPRLLAMTAGPDVSGMIALADDEKKPEIVRELAIEALSCLVARGELPRDALIILLRRILSKPRSKRDANLITFIAMITADIHPGELIDDIGMQLAAGNVDTEYLSMDELSLIAREPVEKVLKRTRESLTMSYFEDVVAEMSGWDCFNTEEVRKSNREWQDEMEGFFTPPPDLPDFDGIEDAVISQPAAGARPAVGRNDPCPCGSGKKFKKCCGQDAS